MSVAVPRSKATPTEVAHMAVSRIRRMTTTSALEVGKALHMFQVEHEPQATNEISPINHNDLIVERYRLKLHWRMDFESSPITVVETRAMRPGSDAANTPDNCRTDHEVRTEFLFSQPRGGTRPLGTGKHTNNHTRGTIMPAIKKNPRELRTANDLKNNAESGTQTLHSASRQAVMIC